MSPRIRITLVVVAAALAAAAVAVAATRLTAERGRVAGPEPREGRPALYVDVRDRPPREAAPVVRGAQLYARKRYAEAAAAFAQSSLVEGRIGYAIARWPVATIATLRAIVREEPRSAAAHLNLGFALFQEGRDAEALAAWRRAAEVQPDTSYAVRANDVLHPNFVPGLPTVVLERPDPLLEQGVRLQRLGRPVSARRVFARAAARSPDDVQALVADAVGRFDKARPEETFSRLGPLARRFPHAATVRFHLGLCLVWMQRVEEARRQFRQAAEIAPESRVGREAKRFLDRLENVGPMG